MSIQIKKTPPHLTLLLKPMIEAAHEAGKVLLKYFGKKTLRVDEKKDAGLVTLADLQAEKAALRILKRARPDFSALTEESNPVSAPPSTFEGRWILDPLDGTTNFVHRFPMFCVSIGAEWEGQIVVGVIYHPILNETYVAVRGKGALLNQKRIHVSSTAKIRDSLLTTGFSYRKDESLHAEMQAFERLSGISRAIRRPGSAALDLAYTARGVFDGFWERRLSPWDVAAGSLLVEEAGGKVTNFKGDRFHISHSEILASNKNLHAELLNIISS